MSIYRGIYEDKARQDAYIESLKTSWREQILKEMDRNGDGWGNIVFFFYNGSASPDAFLDHRWYAGDVDSMFTLWTEGHVYFPAVYDDRTWCASVCRHPCAVATPAIGGGP